MQILCFVYPLDYFYCKLMRYFAANSQKMKFFSRFNFIHCVSDQSLLIFLKLNNQLAKSVEVPLKVIM